MTVMNNASRIMAGILVVSALLWSDKSNAGLDTQEGNERGLWTKGYYSVIVARVGAIKEAAPSTERATLEPLCTIAGLLDPSDHRELHVVFYSDGMTSSIRSVPKRGDLILAVIRGDDFIVSDICRFMPDESSLVVVNGLNDPRIPGTLKRIQDARPHERRDSNVPATQPASGKGN
ncbi:MAG TPA: hypothetical protein VFW23_11345 [Tepidisphaeraceae bacterium]|nr:hypothetical protein [Tepidisphaeraceae bacterium]